ncbi:MAG: hypothetical protein [aquatic viral metagenome]
MEKEIMMKANTVGIHKEVLFLEVGTTNSGAHSGPHTTICVE